MSTAGPRLSRWRTFLLWALAVVWFSEMTLWAVRPLSEFWTVFWQQLPPDDSELASALFITHALESSAKGALGVLAVFALRSRSPSVRSALFVPMALVPPLNLAFQFRAQGFPPGPTTVGAVLSAILWGSFIFFRDPPGASLGVTEPSGPAVPSRWESLQRVWLAANGIVLTLVASVFLFLPGAGLRLIFPCLSESLASESGVPEGLTYSSMAVGTHVAAVTVATWIATARTSSHPSIGRAVAAAITLQAGLVCVLPLRALAADLGRGCAASSYLVLAVPLFGAWVVYAVASYRAAGTRDNQRRLEGDV